MNLTKMVCFVGAGVATLTLSACNTNPVNGALNDVPELKVPPSGYGASWISEDAPDPSRINVNGLKAEFRAPTAAAPNQYGAITMVENCVLLAAQYGDPTYYDVAIIPNDGHQRGDQTPGAPPEGINFLIENPPVFCR